MYIHVVLFIFLIFLFVLSLEQAQNDLQQINSDHTSLELHPGVTNTKCNHSVTDINQDLSRDHVQQNSLNTDSRSDWFQGSSEIKLNGSSHHTPSKLYPCSVWRKSSYEREPFTRDSNSLLSQELSNGTILRLVPDSNLTKSYENYSASGSVRPGKSSANENEYFLNKKNLNFIESVKERTNSFYNSTYNSSNLNSYVLNNTLTYGYFNNSMRKRSNTNYTSAKNSIYFSDTDNQENAIVDYSDKRQSNSQVSEPIAVNLNNKLKVYGAPSFMSPNEFYKLRLNNQDSGKEASECNKLDYKLFLVPMLASKPSINDCALVSRFNSSDKAYIDYIRTQFILNKDFNKNFTNKYQNPMPITTSTEHFLRFYQKAKSEDPIYTLEHVPFTENPTKPKSCSEDSENDTKVTTEKDSNKKSNMGKGNYVLYQKSDVDVLSNHNNAKLNMKSSDDLTPSEDQKNDKSNEKFLMGVLQNFFKLLADSKETSNNELQFYQQNTQLNYFTLDFKPDSDSVNSNDPALSTTENICKSSIDVDNKDIMNMNFGSDQHLEKVPKNEFKQFKDTFRITTNRKVNKISEQVQRENGNIAKYNVYPRVGNTENNNRISKYDLPKGNHGQNDDDGTKLSNIMFALNNIINQLSANRISSETSTIDPTHVRPRNELKNPSVFFSEPQPPFKQIINQEATNQSVKPEETTNDYFNPLIYNNKKMFPEIMSGSSDGVSKVQSVECNRGVISGKVYVTGPENLTPEQIHIINPEILRTLHDNAGPRNIHFILDNCNGKPPVSKDEIVKDVPSETVNLKQLDTEAYTKEFIINQLKKINLMLTKLRKSIKERLQVPYDTYV